MGGASLKPEICEIVKEIAVAKNTFARVALRGILTTKSKSRLDLLCLFNAARPGVYRSYAHIPPLSWMKHGIDTYHASRAH